MGSAPQAMGRAACSAYCGARGAWTEVATGPPWDGSGGFPGLILTGTLLTTLPALNPFYFSFQKPAQDPVQSSRGQTYKLMPLP